MKIIPDSPLDIHWPPGIRSVHSDTPPDQEIAKILQIQRKFIIPLLLWVNRHRHDHHPGEIRAKGLFTRIGAITKPLNGSKFELRTQECSVGNMIADIIRQFTNSTFGKYFVFL